MKHVVFGFCCQNHKRTPMPTIVWEVSSRLLRKCCKGTWKPWRSVAKRTRLRSFSMRVSWFWMFFRVQLVLNKTNAPSFGCKEFGIDLDQVDRYVLSARNNACMVKCFDQILFVGHLEPEKPGQFALVSFETCDFDVVLRLLNATWAI